MATTRVKHKDLFKRGDYIVWRHWDVQYADDSPHDLNKFPKRKNVLIEDRGIILSINKNRRPTYDGSGVRKYTEGCWKAVVFFANGQQTEMPLACLKHVERS